MTQEIAKKDVTSLSFEEAMAELEAVVRQLEDGRAPLEQAIVSYERGAALKKRCEELLKSARLKVEEIYQNRDGEVAVKDSTLQALVDGPETGSPE